MQDVIKLNNKEILVTSNYGSKALDFWDLKTYTKLNTVKGVYTECLYQGMIELPNGHIAVSSHAVGNPIVIVNPENYTVVKEIKEQKVITHARRFVCLINIRLFMCMMVLLFRFLLMRIIR